MNLNDPVVQWRFQISGWVLFIFSALFFIATSIQAGDTPGLIGALFFLVACFVFLVPLISIRGTLGGPDSGTADTEATTRN